MDSPFPARDWRLISAVLVVLLLTSAVVTATHKSITQGFDEVAQISYIAQIQHDADLPSLDHLRLLDPRTFQFTPQPSYLNHPPAYYWILAKLGPSVVGHPQSLVWYRLANAVLAGLGLLACLSIASGFGRFSAVAFIAPVICTPVLMSIAAAVNNDNAAFCGGAIAIAALFRLLREIQARWVVLAAAGLIMASWAKLTGFLLVGGSFVAVIGYLLWRRRFPAKWALIAAAAFVIAGLPYAVFVAQYGSPAPNTPAQQAMLLSVSGWASAPRLSVVRYVAWFAGEFVFRWLPIMAAQVHPNYPILIIPAMTVLIAVAGIVLSARRVIHRGETPLDATVIACAVAVGVTLICHVSFSYQRHLATGWLMDAAPRYYLPVLPFIPLACLSVAGALGRRWRTALLAFLALGPAVFLALGTA